MEDIQEYVLIRLQSLDSNQTLTPKVYLLQETHALLSQQFPYSSSPSTCSSFFYPYTIPSSWTLLHWCSIFAAWARSMSFCHLHISLIISQQSLGKTPHDYSENVHLYIICFDNCSISTTMRTFFFLGYQGPKCETRKTSCNARFCCIVHFYPQLGLGLIRKIC